MAEYRPGVCNIGREQRRKRFYGGLAGLALAIPYTAWVLATDRPSTFLAGTFVLLTGGILGYLQARMEFCAGFAALARYDLSGSGGEAGTVTEAELRRKDLLRGLELLTYAAGMAGAITLFLFAADGFLIP